MLCCQQLIFWRERREGEELVWNINLPTAWDVKYKRAHPLLVLFFLCRRVMSSCIGVKENVTRTQLSCLRCYFIAGIFCAHSNKNTHSHTLLTIAGHLRSQALKERKLWMNCCFYPCQGFFLIVNWRTKSEILLVRTLQKQFFTHPVLKSEWPWGQQVHPHSASVSLHMALTCCILTREEQAELEWEAVRKRFGCLRFVWFLLSD